MSSCRDPTSKSLFSKPVWSLRDSESSSLIKGANHVTGKAYCALSSVDVDRSPTLDPCMIITRSRDRSGKGLRWALPEVRCLIARASSIWRSRKRAPGSLGYSQPIASLVINQPMLGLRFPAGAYRLIYFGVRIAKEKYGIPAT